MEEKDGQCVAAEELDLDIDLTTNFLDSIQVSTHAPELAGPCTPKPATKRGRPFVDTKALEKRLNEELKPHLKRIIANDPRYAGLSSKISTTVRPKAAPGAGQVLRAVVQRILTPTGAMESQADVRAAVESMYPTHTVYKDWTRPLSAALLGLVKKHLQSAMAPFNDITVRKDLTLSELHRLARGAFIRSKHGEQTFKATIIVSPERILINGHSFAITSNKSGGNVYRTARINVAHLERVLAEQ